LKPRVALSSSLTGASRARKDSRERLTKSAGFTWPGAPTATAALLYGSRASLHYVKYMRLDYILFVINQLFMWTLGIAGSDQVKCKGFLRTFEASGPTFLKPTGRGSGMIRAPFLVPAGAIIAKRVT
jgi:hypothetical protein